MSTITLSFYPKSQRLTIREWYDIAGPDGTIEKNELPGKDLGYNERSAYGTLTTADMQYQSKILHKNKYVLKASYSYEDYLRFRIALSNDRPTNTEKEIAKLRFRGDPEPDYFDNGNFKSGMLDGNQTYMGIKLAEGRSTLLYRDGWIDFSYLAEDQVLTVGGRKLPCKGLTEIQGHPNHTIKMIILSKDTYISWTDSKGKDWRVLAQADTSVTFHDNGMPRQIFSKVLGGFVQIDPNGDIDY